MKKLALVTFGVFALAIGSAHAGGEGGCVYGKHSAMLSADANDALENSATDESADPKLLALLKKKPATESVETATN